MFILEIVSINFSMWVSKKTPATAMTWGLSTGLDNEKCIFGRRIFKAKKKKALNYEKLIVDQAQDKMYLPVMYIPKLH